MHYNIHFSCVNHIGKCRDINQDNFICNGEYRKIEDGNIEIPLSGCVSSQTPTVFGVFDGMGGEDCGEIASYIAAHNASTLVLGTNISSDLSKFCLDTNEKICKYVDEHLINAMGTTAAMLVFANKEIVLCNIGDSKIFRYSDETLEQISYDHITISAFGTKPPLSQNLGIPQTELLIDPYIAQGKYNNGDIYLLCSDGLTDMLDIDKIKDILKNTEFDEITPTLLKESLDKGGKDNISIIACRVEQKTCSLIKKFIRTIKKEV